MKLHVFALALVLGLGCAHVPPPRTFDEGLKQLDDRVAGLCAKNGPPLATLGIVRGGKLIWFDQCRRRSLRHAPLTESTVFRIGSITKTLTGIALLQLRDAGKLSLDDPLSKYLPEAAKVTYPGAEHPPILLRHLVTHTSGLPRHAGVPSMSDPISDAELARTLDGLPLDFAPGAHMSYSNYGMTLAGLVVAKASGERYRDYVTQHVLLPLGMTSTLWDPPPAALLATGYTHNGPNGADEPIGSPSYFGEQEAAGGLYSTVGDLGRLAAFELAAWDDADGDAVLSRASRRESQQELEPSAPSGVNLFLGWGTGFGRIVSNGGSVPGYRALLQIFPERDIGIVGLTSGSYEAFLARSAAAAVELLGPLVPARDTHLGPELADVVERAMVLVNDPSFEQVQQLFSREGLESAGDTNMMRIIRNLHAKLGTCEPPAVVEGGSSHALLHSNCANGTLTFRLDIELRSRKIVGWGLFEKQ